MHFEFTREQEAFRDEVREFMLNDYPESIKYKVSSGYALEKEDYVESQRALHVRGWAGVNWPAEYGGTGWGAAEKIIFTDELFAGNGIEPMAFGVNYVAPIVWSYGDDAQKARFLPPTLACDIFWCQGYSEPGAGSDLASLKTAAVRDGDRYIVNGQKTWTTMGHWADWIFCLVRTGADSARRQDGISFMLIDMSTPGITVKPIIMLDGGHEINEVFFDDVEVPAENLIGEEGKGWTYGKVLLQHERTTTARVYQLRRWLQELKDYAADTGFGQSPLTEDPAFAAKLADVEIAYQAHEYTWLRAMLQTGTGESTGTTSSILKLRASWLIQRIDELRLEAAGYYALPHVPLQFEGEFDGNVVGNDWAANTASRYFNFRKDSIYGGSSEVQRSIIAKHVLGL